MRAVLGACLALLAWGMAATAQPARSVAVYGWADEIDPRILDAFTAETGVSVLYDAYSTPAEAEAKLKAGGAGYDVVIVPSAVLSRLAAAKRLTPLVPPASARPDLLERVRGHDPGNRFAAILAWGTVGIAAAPKRVRDLVPNQPLDTLDLFLKPQVATRLKECGLAVVDAPTIVTPIVLSALGRPPDSARDDDLKRVADVLMRLKPILRPPLVQGQPGPLASGDLCAALTTSNDAADAARRAQDAVTAASGPALEVTYQTPREGGVVWFDMLAIPADAPHPAEARRLVDMLTRADVARQAAGYLNASSGLDGPSLAGRKLFLEPAYDERARAALDRMWKAFVAAPESPAAKRASPTKTPVKPKAMEREAKSLR